MSTEPENHTLRLLQEIRTEIKEMREDLSSRIESSNTLIENVKSRVDGNTIILNMLASLLHNHEERIDRLEEKKIA